MVMIPQYVARQSLETPRAPELPGQVPVDDSIGQALSASGDALTGLGQRIEARQRQQDTFDAQIGHDTAKARMQQAAIELERNAPADGRGLHDEFMQKVFQPVTQEYLSTIKDPQLRVQYTALINKVDKEQWSNIVANREYEIGNKHSLGQVTAMQDGWIKQVAADPTAYENFLAEGERIADTAPNLTSAQRAELKTKFRTAIPAVIAEALQLRDQEALFYARGQGTKSGRNNFLLGRLTPLVQRAENAPGDPRAVSNKGAIGLMQVTLDAGVDVAKHLGDTGYLEMDPAQRAEYLKRPDVNLRYGVTYLGLLLERYRGDAEASLIAYNAGMGNADKWLKAGRDYAALPKRSETEPYVTKILNGLGTTIFAAGPEAPRGMPGARIPITTGTQPGRQPLQMQGINPKLLDKWELVQGAFGRAVPVISGNRDATRNAKAGGAMGSQHLHGNAIDIDVSGMSKPDRLRLIETASALGMRGIGVYKSSLHFDVRDGAPVMWGPSRHADSVPAWAFSAAVKHRAGKITDADLGASDGGEGPDAPNRFVSPAFADMPLADAQLWDARAVAWQQNHDDSRKQAEALAKVETGNAMDDDLAQLRLTGHSKFSGAELDNFEQQIAKTQGPEKLLTWREDRVVNLNIHDRSADLDQMTDEAITQRLASLKPAAGADFDMRKRIYDGVGAQAETIRDARKADPATAVLEAFPAVEAAWEGVSPKDPATVKAAIQATLKAQQAIGIAPEKLAPLPAQQAGKIAQLVSDPELPVGDRLSALVSAILVTPDAGQQAQIIRQMVKGGLPPQIANVVEAWKRNDSAATRRLFQAAMLDPEKAPKLGTNDNKLGALVEEKLLGDGTVGQIFYGLDLGDPRSADVAASDLELAKSAARIAMAGGMSQDAAVDQAIGDIFGPVDVVDNALPSGGAVKGLVDTGVDSTALLSGFAKANEKMVDVLHGYIARSYAAVPKDAEPGLRAVFEASHKNEMNRILADGIWRNNGAGWSYYDPVSRAFVSDDEGRAITFTTDDLLKMGGEKAPGVVNDAVDPENTGADRGAVGLPADFFPDGAKAAEPAPAAPIQPQGRTKPPKGGYQRSDDSGFPYLKGGADLKQQRKEMFDNSTLGDAPILPWGLP